MRDWLIRGACCALVLAAALWLGLVLGRPLYYTDGEREIAALSLTRTGMWVWPSPEPVCELPGPVVSRVGALRDGRLVYGRSSDDGGTELVVFAPDAPRAGAEPLAQLHARGAHDLAPAVGADGRLWFASDRPGGAGGFDLYVAEPKGDGFAAPRAVATANTMYDETDPAPDPAGGLVFARVDRQRQQGDDGVLLRWDGGEFEPVPVFAGPRRNGPVDRDPMFAREGDALWFVRQENGRARLMRTARLHGAYDPPLAVDEQWATRALRSPLPLADHRLGLLRPAQGDLGAQWLVSRGREVLPWWTGQAWLETVLLGAMLTAALLLLLLFLGRRWRSLDLVTLCLLLSLLVHLLLMLWLMGVEIAGSLLPGDDDRGTVSVTLSDGAVQGGGAGDAAQLEDLAASARLASAPRSLQADAPTAALAAAGEAVAVASSPAAWNGDVEAGHEVDAPAPLRDERQATPSRTAEDRATPLAGARLNTVAASAAAAAAAAAGDRSAAAESTFAVTVPTGPMAAGAAPASAVAAPRAPLPSAPTGNVAAASNSVATAALRDTAPAAAAAAPRAGRDGVASAPSPTTPLAAPSGDGGRVGSHAGTASGETVAAPQAELAANEATVAAAAAAPTTASPLPRAGNKTAPALAGLHDAPTASALSPVAAATGAGQVASPLRPVAAAAPNGSSGSVAAARAASSAAVGSAAGEAVPVPGSGLEGGRRSGDLAGGSAALPLPAMPRGGARAALRDERAATAAGPVAAGPSPSPTGGIGAAALPQLAGNDRGEASARRAGESNAPAASNVAAPGSDLAAGKSTPRIGGGALPMPAPSARRDAGPKAPLADGRGAVAALASSTPAPGRSSAALQAATLPALAAEPVGATASRRSAMLGIERSDAAVTPPGSLLARAPAVARLGAVPVASASSVTPYSNRFGPQKQKALEQFGGTVDTERAVRDGLRYLASIQRLDGGWGDPEQFDEKYGFVRIGKSALCLLAFLGAGHTPSSQTEHSAVARRAVDFLLQLQERDTGAFGQSSAYGHGIATYALAECYGITKDARLRRPVEDALSWILQHQGPRRDRRNVGGWGYFSPGLQAEDDYARVSISTWMVMALESARMSGIELPEDVLPNARRFIEQAWDQQNKFFRYNHKRSRLESEWPTLPSSTPAGAFCLMLLGEAADSERLRDAVAYTVARRPEQYRRYSDDDFVLRGQGNVYFWYYGTLCSFLAGGEAWQQWNERLSKLLPAAQDRDGSFAPIDAYARTAGDNAQDRAFTTSMCVLSLEVYYRYFTPLLLGR